MRSDVGAKACSINQFSNIHKDECGLQLVVFQSDSQTNQTAVSLPMVILSFSPVNKENTTHNAYISLS